LFGSALSDQNALQRRHRSEVFFKIPEKDYKHCLRKRNLPHPVPARIARRAQFGGVPD
jgi:hypothetical protein